MVLHKEYIISFVMIIAAIALMAGGYSAVTGKTVRETGLRIALTETEYIAREQFQGSVVFHLDDFLPNLDLVVYVDDKEISRINIKQYLVSSSTPHATANRIYGNTKIETIQLDSNINIPLSAYVGGLEPGKHKLTVKLSEGDLEDSAEFVVK